jgi:hypothetical protein
LVKASGHQNEVIEQKGDFMLNKLFLFALVACAFSNAAMIGDFAPMKVGNKWVYSDFEGYMGQFWSANRTIKITSMAQHGDSIFYTVLDSTYINEPGYKTYLELNNSIYLYDPSTKKYIDPTEEFFKFHQLPDTILKKVTFSNQSLYYYSIEPIDSNCNKIYSSCSWNNRKWIQNFGLFYWSNGYSNYYGGIPDSKSSVLKLVSFNDQPLDSSISIIAHNNPVLSWHENPPIYADTRSQIHRRGLSETDHISVELYDCRGKLLFSSGKLPGTFMLNTSQFSSGSYILKYRVNNGIWRYLPFAKN